MREQTRSYLGYTWGFAVGDLGGLEKYGGSLPSTSMPFRLELAVLTYSFNSGVKPCLWAKLCGRLGELLCPQCRT